VRGRRLGGGIDNYYPNFGGFYTPGYERLTSLQMPELPKRKEFLLPLNQPYPGGDQEGKKLISIKFFFFTS
jgi:hypothetical protein